MTLVMNTCRDRLLTSNGAAKRNSFASVVVAVLFVGTTLTGCSSEVDKCVDSQMRAWSAEQAASRDNPSKSLDIFQQYEISKGRQQNPTKEQVEANARLACMSVWSQK